MTEDKNMTPARDRERPPRSEDEKIEGGMGTVLCQCLYVCVRL